MTTKVINIETFLSEMSSGGTWCICEASETMKIHVRNTCPENYDTEIRKYETLQKFIDDGRNIIVISITDNEWGGVYSFRRDDVFFKRTPDRILFVRSFSKADIIMSVSDYLQPAGEITITTGKGNLIRTEKYILSDSFYNDLIKSGYVTQIELDKYIGKMYDYELPIIKTVAA